MPTTDKVQRKRFDTIVSLTADSSADARLTITTPHEDREGDILVSEGAVLDAYRRNPVVLFSHDHYSLPVGRSTSLTVIPREGIRADFVWLKHDAFAAQVRNAFEQGVLNAASVGFRPLKWEPLGGTRGYRYTQWELLEWSLCPVPANPHAVRVLKSLGLGPDKDDFSLVIDEATVRRAVEEGVTEGFATAGGHTNKLAIDETAVRRAVTEGVAAGFTAAGEKLIGRSAK